MMINASMLAVITANVILTFEDGPQANYNAKAVIPLIDASPTQLETIEVDVIDQILAQRPDGYDMDQLVKISLCYDGYSGLGGRGMTLELDDIVEDQIQFLCRNQAKYYFQPNQRDDYEQRIVDRTGVASKTRELA